jgi:rubrerythrin
MLNLGKTTFELERLFRQLNTLYFNDKLPRPIITVQSSGKRPAFGWCSNDKRWHENGKTPAYYEINISAEYLTRSDAEIVTTLLHEMVHLYCSVNGIKDTSRSGTYHNERYKAVAEAHGLIITKNDKYGWHDSTLQESSVLDILKVNSQVFKVARQAAQTKTGGKKSSSRKYICPECGMTVRATKEVNIVCGDCQEPMTIES